MPKLTFQWNSVPNLILGAEVHRLVPKLFRAEVTRAEHRLPRSQATSRQNICLVIIFKSFVPVQVAFTVIRIKLSCIARHFLLWITVNSQHQSDWPLSCAGLPRDYLQDYMLSRIYFAELQCTKILFDFFVISKSFKNLSKNGLMKFFIRSQL